MLSCLHMLHWPHSWCLTHSWTALPLLCASDHPAVLPTYIARALAFSYMAEIARLPALADFTRAVMKAFFGGDASEWERALLMPHYSATGMPACGLHQVWLCCVLLIIRFWAECVQ
eukprot:GHRR01036114.1.p1 GENE.GHRR01036114.1~~GHRR01036114.1.p1  ORF type:complete len:116 (-),score=20.06 GHRR01036114.1:267-614(-)